MNRIKKVTIFAIRDKVLVFMEKKVSYIIAVINEFALAHTLNSQQAYRYLSRYKGLEFIDKHYEIEHTLSFEDVVEDLTGYCKGNGGALV